jgi:hypothetical protein
MSINKKIIYSVSLLLFISIVLNIYTISKSTNTKNSLVGTYAFHEQANPYKDIYFAFREDGAYRVYTPDKILFDGKLDSNITTKKSNIFHVKDEQVDFYIVFMENKVYSLGFNGAVYSIKKVNSVYSVTKF